MEIAKRLSPAWFDVEHDGETIGFLLAPLTGPQVMNVQQLAAERIGDAFLAAAEYSVQDWRGITEGGESVKVTSARKAAVFADAALLAKVAGEVLTRSRLKETEAKN